MKITALCGFVAILLSFTALGADPAAAVEKVQFRSKTVFVWAGGKVLEVTDKVNLPFGIVVQTNGTFTVKGGKERALRDGDTLDADGMLATTDGSIMPVLDHVAVKQGHVVVFKDGESTELHGTLQLGDGSVVSDDGKITPRSGTARRMLDGELFQIEGGELPAHDTITMQKGQVIVQKDGSRIAIDPGRSITMNDGTKVMGDGTIIKANDDRTILVEGQIIIVEGVVIRPR